VLRGLHFQKGAYAQAKLLRVTHGEVLDVAVDIRPDSETFLQVATARLSSENKKQLFVPRGFAHGFIVLSDTVVFNYKCDNFYNKASEGGIIYNDDSLKIDWLLDSNDFLVSEKDLVLLTVKELF
jgi:dTDP-4-dehydrorhamnose 3,5-epimerase